MCANSTVKKETEKLGKTQVGCRREEELGVEEQRRNSGSGLQLESADH